MLYVAVDDSYSFYRKGMELFLEELFMDKENESLNFNLLTKHNVMQADVIVKSFVAGAEYICQPILKFRSKPGLIIGVYDGDKNPYHNKLPLCIKDIVFVHRAESLKIAREQVIQAWNENLDNPKTLNCKKCLNCKYQTLTPQQYSIAKYMLCGNDIAEIAEVLNINVKTVSAHKRLMMNKFNLDTDCELLEFLKTLKTHNPPVHLFANH